MQTNDFDFDLPDELIARYPLEERSASRLLHLDGQGTPHDRRFTDLPQLVAPGDLLVFNNTRVIPARLHGQKDSGGKVEVLVERVLTDHEALVHLRSSHSPKAGARLTFGTDAAEVAGRQGALFHLRFLSRPVMEVLHAIGEIPLPPYMERPADAADRERYQTVYARHEGAVAAPTAGLHFDEPMLARLQEMGVRVAFVTLHVGAGTFQPVRVDDVREHVMHSERFEVPEETAELVARTRAQGGRVTAIGTTSLRALEGASVSGRLVPGFGETDIFITPGYAFRSVDRLFTNFHLPKSTLMMLVSALAGMEPIRRAYRHAVAQRYRFFSYGDAMLIDRPE